MRKIDTREPWGSIRAELLETGWEQEALAAGDFCFSGHNNILIGGERKTITDFVASIGDRISRQLEALIETYDTRILLIEGNWKYTLNGTVKDSNGREIMIWSHAWNFIRTWQDKGITIEMTVSPSHTIKRLNELYVYYQDSSHFGGLNRKTYTDDRILAFPTGCRGKTGEKVLTRMRSLRNVALATTYDLEEIDGIGSKKADLINLHFNREK